METDTQRSQRILIAVDDSEAACRAIDYICQVLGGRADFELLLYHRLPPLPPELREHGGSEHPERESQRREELASQVAQWVRGLEEQTRPVLEQHRRRLVAAGIPESAIRFVLDEDVAPGESLDEALRRAAQARGCHTIVIAREHLSGIREAFGRHVSDELARKPAGFAVWVVD